MFLLILGLNYAKKKNWLPFQVTSLKIKHSAVDIDTFWISIQKEFLTLAEKALLVLLQFSTSYLSELGFSTLNNIKNRKRKTTLH